MRLLPMLLLAGCATSPASAITSTADALKANVDAVKAVDADLPPAIRVAAKPARAYFVASMAGVVAAMPACTTASVDAAFTAVAAKAGDAFIAFMTALRPPAPPTAEIAPLPRDPRKAAIQVAREWAAVLKHPSVHTAALSGGDIGAIISAVLGGASALVGGGVSIANAVKGATGQPADVTACVQAVAALQADVAGLPVALQADDAKVGP